MELRIDIPDEVVTAFDGPEHVTREVLEAFAADAYRSRRLSRGQVSLLLRLDYWQTQEFLDRHGARREYTLADLESDRETLNRVLGPK